MPVEEPSNALISVVIPTYNRAHLVLDAIWSVVGQSYRPLEIVVVDDGSQDETQAVIEAWVAEHREKGVELQYVYQENQGGNVARNTGIQSSTGKYVAFLDSDDCWNSQKLALQLEVFRMEPEVGAVYSGLRHVKVGDEHGGDSASRIYPSGNILSQMLVRDVTAPTSTYMVRRKVFDEVGFFDVSLQARQDWDMWIRVASAYKIGCVGKPLVDFREHEGERTASNPMKEVRAYEVIIEKYAHLRAKEGWRVRAAAMGAYYKRMGRVYFHHKLSLGKAFIFSMKSLCVWPFDFDAWAAFAGMLMPTKLRASLHRLWNRVFGATAFGIKSH